MTELEIIRRAFARQVLAAAGVVHAGLEDALATVPREDFLGPGPWPIVRFGRGYVDSPSDDPVYVCANVLVGLDTERKINNGMPGFHALLTYHLDPRPGDHVVHIGAGVGYYSALIAALVGPDGQVTAIEQDAALAKRAAANLAGYGNVAVVEGDGTEMDFAPADGIYVNAGATRPDGHWLDRLKRGGRLILPLTTDKGFGAGQPMEISRRGGVFRIESRDTDYAAEWISAVAIYPCAGARDPASEAALARAFKAGGWREVRSLRLTGDLAAERCWLQADGWCLAYDTKKGV